jgi:hypothetical protein
MALHHIQARGITGNTVDFDIPFPDKCPHCHVGIQPKFFAASVKTNGDRTNIDAVFLCPISRCNKLFIMRCHRMWLPSIAQNTEFFVEIIFPVNTVPVEFSEEITKCSPSFCEIYNEAFAAEENGLLHVAGPGYGKALEFLIKDYLVELNPSDAEAIKKEFLGHVIKTRVENQNVKNIAERATWLRNDETHYVRKFDKLDLKTLKTLINVTVTWIDNDLKTKRYMEEIEKK